MEEKASKITNEYLLSLLDKAFENKKIEEIVNYLNVAKGTILRWKKLKKVPKQYIFDLLKINNINIDYSNYSFQDKDQYYTPIDTALECFNIFKKILNNFNENIKDYVFIEPSAGNGNFLKVLPKNTLAFDIEPKNNDSIKKQDYLNWYPHDNVKRIAFGNPPFGLRGHLALKFINHSYDFCDYVCFILPQFFESDGKGTPRKRVKKYNLIYSGKINQKFLDPKGNEIKINCIFQIWSKYHKNDKYIMNKKKIKNIKVLSLSNEKTPSTKRNVKMLHKCDIYLPSTCFGKNNMRYYESFNDLPNNKGYGIIFKEKKNDNIEKFKNIDWSSIAFLSTNSAYNIRTSMITSLF